MRMNGESWDERLLLTRIDMVWGDAQNPELTNAELEPIKAGQDEHDPASMVNGVLVKGSEFRWHRCPVRLYPAPTTWLPIWQWFDLWFDLQGLHEPDRKASRTLFTDSQGSNPVWTAVAS